MRLQVQAVINVIGQLGCRDVRACRGIKQWPATNGMSFPQFPGPQGPLSRAGSSQPPPRRNLIRYTASRKPLYVRVQGHPTVRLAPLAHRTA
ncbi:hypothetical protein BC834DRAFT_860961 [Gloeopeniophorella convolvens]|nr:hypothetical protein BC834DRAFT_860961 [Gloeopeniophorella convolvens]